MVRRQRFAARRSGQCWGVLYIIGLILSGLVVGALGRLAIPGPNPMSIPRTILVGIAGSFLGGLVGYLLFRNGGGLILSVLGAALIVWLLERRQRPAAGLGPRPGFGPRGPEEPYRQ